MHQRTLELLDYHFPDLKLLEHTGHSVDIAVDSHGTTMRCRTCAPATNGVVIAAIGGLKITLADLPDRKVV
jgi:hypothetical protein